MASAGRTAADFQRPMKYSKSPGRSVSLRNPNFAQRLARRAFLIAAIENDKLPGITQPLNLTPQHAHAKRVETSKSPAAVSAVFPAIRRSSLLHFAGRFVRECNRQNSLWRRAMAD